MNELSDLDSNLVRKLIVRGKGSHFPTKQSYLSENSCISKIIGHSCTVCNTRPCTTVDTDQIIYKEGRDR